ASCGSFVKSPPQANLLIHSGRVSTRQTKVRLDLAGMGMGLLRWLLWPRRARDIEEDEPPRRRRKTKPWTRSHTPGVYRIEVDGEAGRFHRDGPPFSFWSSS